MEPTNGNCAIQPSIIFLVITLTVTSIATALLCVAIMTEHWEYIAWDIEKLKAVEKEMSNLSSGGNSYELEWLLNDQVARVLLESKNERKKQVLEETMDENENKNRPALFFVPIHGGIWTFCITLNVEQHNVLKEMGFPKLLCTNYLKISVAKEGSSKTNWQHRMQNLSISCAFVCLIILGSSALTGAFGLTKRQISAVLVTGVMYLLAAIFAIFSLTIIHFKRAQTKNDCFNSSSNYGFLTEGIVVSTTALEKSYNLKKIKKYFEGRLFTTGWSLHLGWGGAVMCIFVSVFWILLSKIMRHSPLNMLLYTII